MSIKNEKSDHHDQDESSNLGASIRQLINLCDCWTTLNSSYTEDIFGRAL
jgi:hypothetical protein